jgi:hypothetical protein
VDSRGRPSPGSLRRQGSSISTPGLAIRSGQRFAAAADLDLSSLAAEGAPAKS